MSEPDPILAPRCRWFEFPIAGAFVFVTILFTLIWHVRTRVDFRHARWYAVGDINDAGGWVVVDDTAKHNMGYFARRSDDDPIELVVLPIGMSLEEADRIQGLFPEARIEWRAFP
jgi:hypothetical protein